MNSAQQSRPSPIHLLLLLEWVLLGVTALIQILVIFTNFPIGSSVINLVGIGIFGAMRWILPVRWLDKIFYTATEFGLISILAFGGNLPSPSMLYIVLTIRNCVLFAGQEDLQRRSRVTVTLLAVVTCLIIQSYRLWSVAPIVKIPAAQIDSVWIGVIILFGLVFLFLHLLVDTLLAERQGQERLAAANDRLRQYALRIEELATVQERNRIARDIHDSLGHSLTAVNIHIAAALRLLHVDLPETETLLVEAKQLGAQALQDVRQSVSLLRADPLQGRSLSEAIDGLVTDFQRSTGIEPTCHVEIDRPLSPELKFTIYRLVQESLTNISKHAAATAVTIGIHQTATAIATSVQDDGKGFDLTHRPAGFGLQGMQERTLALAGELKIDTAPDCGCHIQAIFPLSSP